MSWLNFVFDAVTVMMPIVTSDMFLYTSALAVIVALVCVLVRIKDVAL